MEDDQKEELASSLNSRKKKPNLVCCFKGHTHGHINHHQRRNSSLDVSSSSSSSSSSPAFLPTSPRKSPSSWIRSKASDFPEIKGKYKNFISKMSRHRRHSSADFSYDPLSYSLNFEENNIPLENEEPYRSFTSRLPSSPPKINPTSSAPSSTATGGIMKSFSEMKKVSSPRRRSHNDFQVQINEERRLPEVLEEEGDKVTGIRRRSVEKSSTPRAVAVAEVRRSLENVTPCVMAQTAVVSSSG